MLPILLSALLSARAEDATPPAAGEPAPKKPKAPDHTDLVAIAPSRLSWPAADLRYGHAFTRRFSVEGGIGIGRYRNAIVRVVEEALEEEGLDEPVSMLTLEVGPVVHLNPRFDRGVRFGVSGRIARFATGATVYDDENVEADVDLSFRGTAPLFWAGLRLTWKWGLVLDYRVGGGPMDGTGRADVRAGLKVDDKELAELSTSFEEAFDIPWVVSAFTVGWAWGPGVRI